MDHRIHRKQQRDRLVIDPLLLLLRQWLREAFWNFYHQNTKSGQSMKLAKNSKQCLICIVWIWVVSSILRTDDHSCYLQDEPSLIYWHANIFNSFYIIVVFFLSQKSSWCGRCIKLYMKYFCLYVYILYTLIRVFFSFFLRFLNRKLQSLLRKWHKEH